MITPITNQAELDAALAEIRNDWQNADQQNTVVQARIVEAMEGLEERITAAHLLPTLRTAMTQFDERCDEINGDWEDTNPW